MVFAGEAGSRGGLGDLSRFDFMKFFKRFIVKWIGGEMMDPQR